MFEIPDITQRPWGTAARPYSDPGAPDSSDALATALDKIDAIKKEISGLRDDLEFIKETDIFTTGNDSMEIKLISDRFDNKCHMDGAVLYKALIDTLKSETEARIVELERQLEELNNHFWEVA